MGFCLRDIYLKLYHEYIFAIQAYRPKELKLMPVDHACFVELPEL